jgi:hypothetical protein
MSREVQVRIQVYRNLFCIAVALDRVSPGTEALLQVLTVYFRST